MIKIKSIQIQNFRGIKELTLELNNTNFAVCGPNGTGKSGIVDAIEFALTGNISRLSGENTGELSVKMHGPHVDSRKDPEKASVTLIFRLENGKEATIHRNVKDARNPKINSNDSNIIFALKHVENHPEFALSRRELIKYVLSTPGDRAQEIQALLRFETLEKLRGHFQKICNSCERDIRPLQQLKDRYQDEIIKHFVINQANSTELLTAVNKRRALLNLPVIAKYEANTSIKDGLATSGATSKISKPQAQEDLKKLNNILELIAHSDFIDECKSLIDELVILNENPKILESLEKENLINIALKHFDESLCPVCDTEWEPNEFRKILNGKIKKLTDIKLKRSVSEKKLHAIITKLELIIDCLTPIGKNGPLFTTPIDVQALRDYVIILRENIKQLQAFLPLDQTIKILKNGFMLSDDGNSIISEIGKSISELPEISAQDAARDYLLIGHEKLQVLADTNVKLKSAKSRYEIARKILDTYGQILTEEMQKIYEDVQNTFRDFYREINKEDESQFEAKLIPSLGKLSFDVDFYGKGFFPPGAYHSEGHQDGMGLCLYLALMRHLLKDNFTFAVLDDVLMSVDSGHRRQVCTLLKENFPKTQFILTTHDDIWLKHMKTAGLIQHAGFIHFKTWSVDIGPTEWNDRDVWQEIRDNVNNNDIRAAASLLRHYLEYFSKEACHNLGAKVLFRGDAQYSLNDLFPESVNRLKKLLENGKKAANSWNDTAASAEIADKQKKLNEAFQKSNIEQWQLNPAVHYNEWGNFHKNDFSPLVEAMFELNNLFKCPNCQGIFYTVYNNGSKEALRCGCPKTNINLKIKST